MATLEKAFTKDFFNNFLPKYGQTRKTTPVWDESQKMFIIGNYESAKGNYYYEGVRFCDRIVIKEKVGLHHTWTYIDSIEIYAFNGTSLELVQKKDYDKMFRDETFVKNESERMVHDYIKGCLKAEGVYSCEDQIREESRNIVEGCFKSFLSADYNNHLTRILPQLQSRQ